MLRKPESVLNSSICKLPNLLRPSQQILCQTMGCLLGALLRKSRYEQLLASLIHLLPTQRLPNPTTSALRWLMALGRMGKESEQEEVSRLTAEPQQCGNVPSHARSFGDDQDTVFPILCPSATEIVEFNFQMIQHTDTQPSQT